LKQPCFLKDRSSRSSVPRRQRRRALTWSWTLFHSSDRPHALRLPWQQLLVTLQYQIPPPAHDRAHCYSRTTGKLATMRHESSDPKAACKDRTSWDFTPSRQWRRHEHCKFGGSCKRPSSGSYQNLNLKQRRRKDRLSYNLVFKDRPRRELNRYANVPVLGVQLELPRFGGRLVIGEIQAADVILRSKLMGEIWPSDSCRRYGL